MVGYDNVEELSVSNFWSWRKSKFYFTFLHVFIFILIKRQTNFF